MKFYSDYIRARTLESIPFWIAASIAAVLAAGYAMHFTQIEKFTLMIFTEHPYWLFGLTPICFLLSLVTASGRISPEGRRKRHSATDCLARNGSRTRRRLKLDRLFGVKMACVKWFSSMIAAVGGGIIGP